MTLAEFEEARQGRKEASRAVAATLRECYSAKLRARAERMEKCNNFFLGELCPVCHTFHATQGSRCRDRLCPDCGWTLAIERSSGVRRALLNLGAGYTVFHVVLTKRDPLAANGELLHEECKKLIEGYSKLMRMRAVKRRVWGAVRSLEISNNGISRYHPHIHALWVTKEETIFAPYELNQLWAKACELDYRPVTWIEGIYSKEAEHQETEEGRINAAVAEATKYAIKPSLYMTADAPMLEELDEGLKSLHLFACHGGMAAAYRQAQEELKAEKQWPGKQCIDCGSRTESIALNYKNGGYVL